MKVITEELLQTLITRASESPRQRAHHNVHEVPTDPVQRLFVATQIDSYFRPHRHPEKSEFTIVLRGAFDILFFDEAGKVTERCTIGAGEAAFAFETPANTFHTLLVREPGSLFFEVKRGPYDPQTASEFAPWSPTEGTPEAPGFLARLRQLQVGDVSS